MMTLSHFTRVTLCSALMVSASFQCAQAQNNQISMIERNQELSVLSRSDPSLVPSGVVVGGFTLLPALTVDAEYTDNLYSSQTNQLKDKIIKVKPSVVARADTERHSLNFRLAGEQAYHQDNDAEDYFEFFIGSNARYDLGGGFSFPLVISYEQQTTARGTPDEEGALEPTDFDVFTTSLGMFYEGRLFNFDIDAAFRDLTYSDTLTGTGIRNNQDRNRSETRVTSRLGALPWAGILPFLYAEYREVIYDDTVDDNGFRRDSAEIESGIGARFLLSALASSQFRLGYTNYEQDDARFEAINDYNFLVNLNWEPTTLTALSITGERRIEETSVSTFAASVDSVVRMEGLYELTPAIFIRPGIEFLEKDYEGQVTLERMSYGLDLNYRMNDNVWWNASYEYTKQHDPDASPLISEYERNNFLISLRLQF